MSLNICGLSIFFFLFLVRLFFWGVENHSAFLGVLMLDFSSQLQPPLRYYAPKLYTALLRHFASDQEQAVVAV